MPLPLVLSYYERIPMLAARESLRTAAAVALGSGTLKREAVQSAWRELEDQAGITRRAPRRRPTAIELEALGIRIAR